MNYFVTWYSWPSLTLKRLTEGKSKGSKFRDRLARHRATAIAGDRPAWVDAFLQEFRELFGDLVLNLTVNSMLDGNVIHRNQQKLQLKKVGVFS